MKKKVVLALIATGLMAMPIHAESLGRFEGSTGNIDILGYTIASSDGADYFVALYSYENTKDESNAPWLDYLFTAYQDGVELESGYIYDYKYEDYKSADTKVRPGATLKFYEIFQLASDSPVDVEVGEMFNLDNVSPVVYTFDLSGDVTASTEQGSENDELMASSGGTDLSDLIARIADLEERVSALENKE